MENIICAIIEQFRGFQYLLFTESGTIMTVIGFLTGIIAFFAFKKKTMRTFAVVALVATTLLGANYIYFKYIDPVEEKEMCVVPDVTEMSYSNAQIVLRSLGLKENLLSADNAVLDAINERLVCMQEPVGGTKVEKGSIIVIAFEKIENNTNENADLLITINEYSMFDDGYYYEYPDTENPKSTCFIDFKAGIYGTYEYSRALSEAELANWFHGGKLYDADGNEIGVEGNYPSFWANSNGKFAVEFPEGLSAGTYTYELYQYVDGQYVSDSINFTVE